MHQPPQAAAQAVADLPQRISVSQLTEQHGDELGPAGKAFSGTLGAVLLHECSELGSGESLGDTLIQAIDGELKVLPHFWWSVMARGKDALLP